MTIEQLRRACSAQPFRPFEICLADGQRRRVRSPEFLLVSPRAERTFVVDNGQEEYQIVDLLLVTSFDFSQRPRRTDGRRGSRGNGR